MYWNRRGLSLWLVVAGLGSAGLNTACHPAISPHSTAPQTAPASITGTENNTEKYTVNRANSSDTGAHAMDLPDAVSASPEIAVPWLIRAEREAAHQGDLVQLDALWAQESRVIDRRGGEDSNRYYIWVGKDAVLNRYVVAVFPHAPPRLAADALDDLTIDTQLGGGADREFDPQNPRTGDIIQAVNGNDEWQFIWQEGRWQILELRYSSY